MPYNFDEFLTIGQFSALSGISRPNLIYYDSIDLLKPIMRRENDYRMYDYKQLGTAYQITVYRGMGIPIDEIRHILGDSSPDDKRDMLDRRIAELDRHISELKQQKYDIQIYSENLKKYGSRSKKGRFETEYMQEERLHIGPPVASLGSKVITISQFLIYCKEHGINHGCHIGRMFAPGWMLRREWHTHEYIYFKDPGGDFVKPAGTYLVYTSYTDSSDIDLIYKRVARHIRDKGLSISGGIFEDYPISSIYSDDTSSHIIRIMVPIK